MGPSRTLRSLLALALLMTAVQAQAVLRIEITEGASGARPIAVVPFAWNQDGEPPADIAAIVANDLARSGQFAPMERRDMVSRPTSAEQVRFGNWSAQEVDHLVIGRIEPRGGGGYAVRFQLFDVIRQRQVAGYSFQAAREGLRGLAHEISDLVYEEITGERGAFNTRITFVSTEGSGDAREYTLQVSDYDGYNARPILTSGRPIMSPAWSPDGEHVAYVSFEGGRSAVYVQEVASGERRRVSGRTGINGAPAWSPDGERLAVALSHEGNPELYVLDLESDETQRITNNRAIDTSPTWGPEGRALFFTSDRSGSPQIYRVAVEGSRSPERVTFEGRYNAAPALSPDGERLAFVHREDNGNYRIAVMDRSSGLMRVLTDGQLDESPTFSPNGRMILYATEHEDRGVLGAVSVDGRAAVRLSQAEGNIREPAWGPFRD